MSFHASAENIRVDDGHMLRAALRNGNGDLVDSEIDLNGFIGNSDGSSHPPFPPHYYPDVDETSGLLVSNESLMTGLRASTGNFEWGGSDFSHSAQNITFSIEGDDNCPILRAELANVEGEYQHRDINLSERIGNSDGQLVFHGE